MSTPHPEDDRSNDVLLCLLDQLNHAKVRIEAFERSERTHRAEVEELEGVIRSQEKIIKKLVDGLG